jgi:dTDP-4-dehydrorhamnose reductase
MPRVLKPKLALIGGSSLLSLNLAVQLTSDYDVYLVCHRRSVHLAGVKTVLLNFESTSALWKGLDEIQPNLIINCIGLTNIEKCERDPSLAMFCNSELAGWQAEYSMSSGVTFIHVSTDHLFDGTESYYTEDAIRTPLNQYARSKSHGEDNVLSINPASLVIRTNFFAWGSSYRESFSDFIISNLRAEKSVKLFTDVFFTPVNAANIASYIQGLVVGGNSGVYNVASSERVSKFEFGRKLAACFVLDKDLILPDQMQKRENLVKRPLDMSLDNTKLSLALGNKTMTLEKEIERLFFDEESTWAREVRTK